MEGQGEAEDFDFHSSSAVLLDFFKPQSSILCFQICYAKPINFSRLLKSDRNRKKFMTLLSPKTEGNLYKCA